MNEYVYGVLFNNNCKTYYFKSSEEYDVFDYVIVDTEKGEQYAKIIKIVDNYEKVSELKEIIRKATKDDYNKFLKNLKDADSVLKKCRSLVKELNLEMSLIDASFNFDRTQLVINFSADERVDFRELAKKLAGVYRTRIELHQLGARDKAKQVGGIGVCGQLLCCTNFLKQIESISMNKAKNQNLALNPSKINGSCGRLLCCLCYEDDEYTRCSVGLLPVGSVIKVDGADATIISVDILNRKYKVLVGEEKREIAAESLKNDRKK